jgi:outer membrane protein assembly factor BamB
MKLSTTFVLVVLISQIALATDWPRFRGINGIGVSADKGLPEIIDREKNVIWTKQIPAGNSSPIIVGNRLLFTAHEGDERIVLCLNADTGEQIWRKSIQKARSESFHPNNGPTTPTPASDGKRIAVFFPEFGLIAYDLNGKELWRNELGPFTSVQGLASSPILVDDKVVLLIDTPENAYIAAFDGATGKQIWKTERDTGVLGSYATPTVDSTTNKSPVIIVAGAVELTGYDAASGERIWWARGVTDFPCAPPFVSGDSVYSTEAAAGGWPPFSESLRMFDKDKNGKIELAELSKDNLVWFRTLNGIDRNAGNHDSIVTEDEWAKVSYAGNAGGLSRTKLGGKGNIGQSHVLWRNTKGMPSLTAAVLYENLLYTISDGIFASFNPATGDLKRQQKLADASGEYYASPIAADGKIYLASLKGKVTTLKAGEDWKILSTADLGEQIIATPAIANNKIYMRTEKTLYCFGTK